VQVEDIIGCWATTSHSQGRNKLAAASSSFCDVDAHLLFELLVYHVQRHLLSRLYGKIFAENPFALSRRSGVVVSPDDGFGPCSEKSRMR
jgi:hypothetical protein